MRAIYVIGALLCVAISCGDSTAPTPMTAVRFKVDKQTCVGTATLNFFVDGSQVGSGTLAAGDSSSVFRVTSASHTLGANYANIGGRGWGPFTVDLTDYESWTQLLTC